MPTDTEQMKAYPEAMVQEVFLEWRRGGFTARIPSFEDVAQKAVENLARRAVQHDHLISGLRELLFKHHMVVAESHSWLLVHQAMGHHETPGVRLSETETFNTETEAYLAALSFIERGER